MCTIKPELKAEVVHRIKAEGISVAQASRDHG